MALALLELLHSRGSCNGADIASALHLNRRLVRRCVAVLEELGICVASNLGTDGGYRLVPGFKPPPMMFDDDEMIALINGLTACRRLRLGTSMAAISSALSKIERVVPPQRKLELVSIDEPVENRNSALLNLMTTSIQERRRLRVVMGRSRGQETGSQFDPYGILFRRGASHCLGWDHQRGGLQLISVDQIKCATVSADTFERTTRAEVIQYLNAVEGPALLPAEQPVEILLRTDFETARRNLRLHHWALLDEPGGAYLCGAIDNLASFARELSRLPFDFDVISPPDLRVELADAGRRLLQLARSNE